MFDHYTSLLASLRTCPLNQCIASHTTTMNDEGGARIWDFQNEELHLDELFNDCK